MSSSNRASAAGSSENPYQPPKTDVGPSRVERRGSSIRPGSGPPSAGSRSTFSLECPCGQVIGVTGAQAGSTVQCVCGAEVRVPSLGRLRELAGKDRYESGAGDAIRRMVRSGELPALGTCVLSKEPTNDVMEFEILVPRFFKSEQNRDQMMTLLLGLWAIPFIALIRRPRFHTEGATTVQTPLCISQRYHAKVGRMSQGRLKRLLRTVPVYAELLDENPDARISALGGAPTLP